MSETQNVETSSNLDSSSVNSFENTPVETATIPEPSAAPKETEATPEPEATQAPAAEDELPEFAKRRLGKEQKKHEREMARMRAELEEARKSANPALAQQSYNPPYGAQSPSVYRDPITGKYIDTNTPEGQAIFNYQQEMSQHLTAQEQQQQARAQKEIQDKRYAHFQDSFEDAKDKYPDFEKVIRSSGMTGAIGEQLADFPDPGELGYYLASNPREVERLQRLPAYEMKRELVRHMAEMVSKNNVTRAPAPVKTTGSPAGQTTKSFAHKTLEELKAERRAELSGASRRR